MEWRRGGNWRLARPNFGDDDRWEKTSRSDPPEDIAGSTFEVSVRLGERAIERVVSIAERWKSPIDYGAVETWHGCEPDEWEGGEKGLYFTCRICGEDHYENDGNVYELDMPDPSKWEQLATALSDFLRDFGALRPDEMNCVRPRYSQNRSLGTMFHDVEVWQDRYTHEQFLTLDVTGVLGDIRDLAEAARMVRSATTATEKSAAAKKLLTLAGRVLREDMELVPVFRSGGLAYDARPTTLRAYLWLALFRESDRSPKLLCRFCQRDIPMDSRPCRGRPPAYCPEHRAPRFRQAVRALRAPSMKGGREPDPDELEDLR